MYQSLEKGSSPFQDTVVCSLHFNSFLLGATE